MAQLLPPHSRPVRFSRRAVLGAGLPAVAAIDAGEVALDTAVGEILGGIAAGRPLEATPLAALVSHTSELPAMAGEDAMALHASDLIRRVLVDTDADAEEVVWSALSSGLGTPGDHIYSNLGSATLGHLLAHRAGITWSALLRERLLDPLGLEETRAPLTPADLDPDDPLGHDANGRRVSAWPLGGYAPAGGLRSTVADLVPYLRAQYITAESGGLLAERISDRGEGPHSGIGVAWHLDDIDGQTAVWHNGGTGGFCSIAGWWGDRGIVVLSDTTGSVDELGLDLLTRDLGIP